MRRIDKRLPGDCTRRDALQLIGGMAFAGFLGNDSWSQTKGIATTQGDKRLIVHSASPHNAEPALGDLMGNWITPLESFFVRSHGRETPELDAAAFRVSVEGLVDRPLELSMSDLAALPQAEAVATLTCAGNRRREHNAVRAVSGVQWREGAIGNARWSGVPLAEMLKRAGVKSSAKHVWFESVDQIEDHGQTFPFGGSIPLEKALADHNGTPGALLALRMNGKALSSDHGFPVRTVVPGYIGARSVKWLRRIVVSDQPSPNHFLADVYKLVTEDTKLAQVEAGPIYTFPINAAICEPVAAASLKTGRQRVRGYALPPGNGTTISRIEVSSDSGASWQTAEILSPVAPYCWVLWEAAVSVDAVTRDLIVRATDSTGLIQPEVVPWNMKGYLYNAWHRVPVSVAS
ncbi:MAG: sulfite oxidase [Planctomycetaceae bacterium]|nr:sulfite oxidase [Planctomycetaceae bacterium]